MKLNLSAPFVLLALLAVASRSAEAQTLPPETKVLRDVEYVPGGGHSRSLDLYLPAKKTDVKPPLIVWIHGGAWRSGDKGGTSQALWLLKDGFAMASINYRLSPEARFPAQIEDCKAAIRFLRAHASEYGIDPEHIGVWGSSAGAHLAVLLGTTGGVKELEGSTENANVSCRVQAVCDFFGPSDLLTTSAQAGAESSVQHDDPSAPEAQLIGGPVQQNVEIARKASPITYITPDDPPFLIVHGEKDSLVPVGQSWELDGTLRKSGVNSTLYVVKGGDHGQNFDYKVIGPMVRDFFEQTLRKKK